MKTFKDLTFKDHHSGEGKRAFLYFDNGRGISVLTGSKYFFISEEAPYEVGFIKQDGGLGCVYGTTLVEDANDNDVQGYCTEEDVTLIMEAIQKL